MNRHRIARLSGTNRNRRVISALLLVWLNLAMLPCAMALEGDHGCPGCPPDHHQEMTGHHAHDAPALVDLQADCCELDQVSVDDRSKTSEKKDSSNIVAIATPEWLQCGGQSALLSCSSSDPPDLSGGPPRLHKINCVYLD